MSGYGAGIGCGVEGAIVAAGTVNGEFRRPYARLNDVNLVLMHSWETSIHPLKTVDPVANVVMTQRVSVHKPEYGTKPQVYFIGLSEEVR